MSINTSKSLVADAADQVSDLAVKLAPNPVPNPEAVAYTLYLGFHKVGSS